MKTKWISIVAFFVFMLLICIAGYSQAPQGFSYQAVIRNSSGTPIASQSIKVHILLTNQLGTLTHYGEEHNLTTTPQGVANLTIGAGSSKVGTLTAVPWQSGDIYIKVEIDPTGTSGYQPMGTPVKLNAVPYALFAENAKEVVSPEGAVDTDPIFVVKNKAGQIVFAVYQTGVRAYVSDTSKVKGAKGGFAVGGLTSKSISDGQDYFSITPTSTRIWFNDKVKGAKGGFAVGGLTSKATDPTEYFSITPDSARIRMKNPVKGAKGGFAVGGLTSKGASDSYLRLTPENYFIGQSAGESITTGLYNSFMGYQAGRANTIGLYNSFIGYNAGLSNTQGSSNVFIGNESGKANLLGGNNVFLGFNAGFTNNASNNIFIGDSAGYSNTSGHDNLFIGSRAGWKTNGNENIFIGNEAGYNSLGPVRNVFIGYQAGRANKNGQYNVYMGDKAGTKGTGYYNTILGGQAASTNDFGNTNVVIGYVAGRDMTSANNVYIGYAAGYNNSGTVGGNIFIGPGAGETLSTQDNRLAISNRNPDSTPLIYGEFDNRRVVINGTNSDNINNRTFFVKGSSGGTGAWWNDSDENLKKNITTISDALGKVLNLRGVNFEWKDSNNPEKGIRMGFIAQETEKVIPEVVNKEGEFYSMQYAPITAILVEAMKEQQKKIEELTSKVKEVDALKAELEAIKTLLHK